jgi:hypothetical protein
LPGIRTGTPIVEAVKLKVICELELVDELAVEKAELVP